jgi:hypothetical protein
MDLKKQDVRVAQDRVQCQAVLYMALNLQVSQNVKHVNVTKKIN